MRKEIKMNLENSKGNNDDNSSWERIRIEERMIPEKRTSKDNDVRKRKGRGW